MKNREPQAKLWEQRSDETARAYKAFSMYLDQSPADRNALELYRQFTGKTSAKQPSGWFNLWVKKYQWTERARAYDLEMDRAKRQAEMRVQIEARERWAKR